MSDPATLTDLELVFGKLVSVFLSLAGIALFIMLLLGGFKWLTAGGDPKAVAAAQKTITSAIVGVILIGLSYLILVLIETITGAHVTQFVVFFD